MSDRQRKELETKLDFDESDKHANKVLTGQKSGSTNTNPGYVVEASPTQGQQVLLLTEEVTKRESSVENDGSGRRKIKEVWM